MKGKTVLEFGGWIDDLWAWGDCGINVELLPVSSLDAYQQLCNLIGCVAPVADKPDSLFWQHDRVRGYSAKVGYDCLVGRTDDVSFDEDYSRAFRLLWSSEVPFNIKGFVWKCFLNRLPTKDQLVCRGIPLSNPDLSCVFCAGAEESLLHILFGCPVSRLVWNNIALWTGLDPVMEENPWKNFLEWGVLASSKRVKRRKEGLIWMAVVMGIWLRRNEIVFNKGSCNVNDITWEIKLKVWRWSFFGEIAYSKCNFYDFCKNPLFYLK
ncbi:uncharacterized protein LOC131658095 [Vicia villosa]|uniref:uncharacterized protein LOC131658095 n=1 Tax=Vicia villosa TaxID=3911 RepID=UPI00273AFE9E|nr:uncharacterized protein LOC131658095 [Vicia villosa]